CLRIRPEALEGIDLSSWAVAYCGAEPVRATTLQRFADRMSGHGFRRASLYPCYGLAEASLLVAGGDAGRPPVIRSFDKEALDRNAVVPASAAPPASGAAASALVGCGHAQGGEEILIVDPERRVRLAAGGRRDLGARRQRRRR